MPEPSAILAVAWHRNGLGRWHVLREGSLHRAICGAFVNPRSPDFERTADDPIDEACRRCREIREGSSYGTMPKVR
jgi:hypothetical protein